MTQLFRLAVFLFILCAATALLPQKLQAHCQMPCGIFDDHARVHNMLEDAVTIKKATTMLAELAGKEDPQSINQLVRWVSNKESHAQSIIDTISDYFLTQRVKTSQDDYAERLAKHHAVMIAAMKVKQNTDSSQVDVLVKTIEALKVYYSEPGPTH